MTALACGQIITGADGEERTAVLGRVQALRPCGRLRRPGLGLRAADQ